MTSQTKKGKPSLLKELFKSKSALTGIVILSVLAGLTIYSVVSLPSNISYTWQNGEAWVLYPIDAPPQWINFLGFPTAPTINLSLSQWTKETISAGAANFSEYSASTTFKWSSGVFPQDLAFEPMFSGNASTIALTWVKPQGPSILVSVSEPASGEAYEAQSQTFTNAASQYILNQTGQYVTQLSKQQVISAFFGKLANDILTSSPLSGTYQVTVQVLSSSPMNMFRSLLVVVGNSYGLMGTDNQDRPIDLGLLAGLPNALEIGFLVSIIAVVIGIVFGGLSGYLGGKKDGLMQWVALVILAMPVLPFLVVISFTQKLNIFLEVVFIAALSWPFYAIIARTVGLSVKSQAFVEADKAMGVPWYRVFASHFIPRLSAVTVAYTVLGIPGGILTAESLAFIGIGPGNLITWGGILDTAFVNQAAVFGFWWWVVFPGLMIVLSAIPFVLLGFAIERIIAPRVSAK